MLRLLILAAIFFCGMLARAADPITFGKADLGKVPKGWTTAKTGEGKGCDWSVVADNTTPSKSGYALAQTAEGPSPLFNMCVKEGEAPADLELTVALKSVDGRIDQGGGVVWRYVDANNYYIARFNPLEDNLRLYKVVAGKRTQLASKDDLNPSDAWQVLSMRMKGNEIECSMDGKKHLSAKDDTFGKPGKVGVWTKADARTRFDQFGYTELK